MECGAKHANRAKRWEVTSHCMLRVNRLLILTFDGRVFKRNNCSRSHDQRQRAL